MQRQLLSPETFVEPTSASFKEKGYIVRKKLLDVSMTRALCRYVHKRDELGLLGADQQVPESPAAYGDTNMEILLVKIRPSVEQVTGLQLFPTYSYYRLYKHGAELRRHVDRPACEISVSLNLGQAPEDPWPLWLRGAQGVYAAYLQPGDAVIYRGMECEHWREPFPGKSLAQVFLHYVDANGAHTDWKFDKRSALSIVRDNDLPAASPVSLKQ